jgi:hypothetical protein
MLQNFFYIKSISLMFLQWKYSLLGPPCIWHKKKNTITCHIFFFLHMLLFITDICQIQNRKRCFNIHHMIMPNLNVMILVTIDRIWIDGWIYWTLWYTMHHYTLQYTVAHTHTTVYSHVFTSCCLVAASTADVPLPLGYQSVPSLSYLLLTAAAHNNRTPAVV